MGFTWLDYDPETMDFVESWLDEAAVRTTGLDEGFRDFYEYWAGEEGFAVGENFWCKVVCAQDEPLAVIAFCRYEGNTDVMELVVKPEKRGQGIGTELLKAFLEHFAVQKSEAVIFPGNIASRKAFENAGFYHHHSHEDGTALYFVYECLEKEYYAGACGKYCIRE